MSDKELILNTDFAKKYKFDEALFYKSVDGLDVYMLLRSSWPKGHRGGMPPLAVVENGEAQILSDAAAIYICSH